MGAAAWWLLHPERGPCGCGASNIKGTTRQWQTNNKTYKLDCKVGEDTLPFYPLQKTKCPFQRGPEEPLGRSTYFQPRSKPPHNPHIATTRLAPTTQQPETSNHTPYSNGSLLQTPLGGGPRLSGGRSTCRHI
jgi:hypothetical protein